MAGLILSFKLADGATGTSAAWPFRGVKDGVSRLAGSGLERFCCSTEGAVGKKSAKFLFERDIGEIEAT